MAKTTDAGTILTRIKDEEIDWVDLRFTDPKGKWQHLTMASGVIDDDMLTDGFMFDGSSIAGWKAINESDMILKPDLNAAYVDPFSATPMMVLFCNVVEPSTGELYGRDPRSTATRAEAYLKATGVGDTLFVGPEAEFFMFDDVRFEDSYNASGFKIDDIELPTNTMREYDGGNLAHRPRAKGGYFPVAPVDSAMDIRGEMVATMIEMGLPMDKHHHEVAASQHELGLTYGGLVETADRMQIYKYVVHMVAHAYGKTATFMPKPIAKDNGSGMHTHMSIWKGGKPLFAGNGYAGLSETALYFIGGVIKQQSLRLMPDSLRRGRKGETRRISLPGCAGQSLPRLFGTTDGRSRRNPEPNPSGRSDGQKPLRFASARAGQRPHSMRIAA
jgi:glutamine synthetase